MTFMEPENILEKCTKIARTAHQGQVRKFGDDKDKPYIVHPERVASAFKNSNLLASIAILHDVIEDTTVTEEDLRSEGIPAEIIGTVKCLSKKEGENYLDFIMRVKQNPLACPVKIEDIKDNMSSLQEGSLKDKYRLALYILENYIRT